MTPRSLHVILNAGAGPGHAETVVAEIEAAFAEHQAPVRVHRATDGASLATAAKDAIAGGADMVVAAGGDGTVSTVAACIPEAGVTFGVLPMGTLNHFARDLGIPVDLAGAVKVILDGQRVAVDAAEVNGKRFVNNASLGLYPDIVRDRTRQQRRLGRGKTWAMLWATHAVLRRSPFLHLRLEVDGQPEFCRSPFVFIGNNDYLMEGFAIGKRESLKDGHLSVYTTRRRTRLALMGLAIRALFGRLHQAEDFQQATAREIRIESSHKRMFVATDGEVSLFTLPLEFRVLPGALRVMVPGESA